MIISYSANLSNDYFTNRQDRYIVFRKCKPLCDYFDELVETISKFSFQMSARDTVQMHPGFRQYHPFDGSCSKKDFNREAGALLKAFMEKYSTSNTINLPLSSSIGVDDSKSQPGKEPCSNIESFSLKCSSINAPKGIETFSVESIKRLTTGPNINSTSTEHLKSPAVTSQSPPSELSSQSSSEPSSTTNNNIQQPQNETTTTTINYDTLVFPLLQMRTMGVDQDELVTSNIIGAAPESARLVLATAYFNLTDRYWNAIRENECQENRLIMAHPKAMGFYKAAGMAGELFIYSCVPSILPKHCQMWINVWFIQATQNDIHS